MSVARAEWASGGTWRFVWAMVRHCLFLGVRREGSGVFWPDRIDPTCHSKFPNISTTAWVGGGIITIKQTGLDKGQTWEISGNCYLPFFISFSFLKIFPVSSIIMASPFSHRLSTDTPEQDASTKDRSTPGDKIPPRQPYMWHLNYHPSNTEKLDSEFLIFSHCPKAERGNKFCLLECIYL